jgi:restriction endonuclease S subunit
VPKFEEQKAIANILNKANEQLNKYEQKLEKLQELKK